MPAVCAGVEMLVVVDVSIDVVPRLVIRFCPIPEDCQ